MRFPPHIQTVHHIIREYLVITFSLSPWLPELWNALSTEQMQMDFYNSFFSMGDKFMATFVDHVPTFK
jgi:hypothetical protein